MNMFRKKHLQRTFLTWLPFAVVFSFACLLIYISMQQVFRLSANDPQIQMAEDGADALAMGQDPAGILPNKRIELAKSIAPFMIIYDNQGHIFSSSATLHGKVPDIPNGVFTDARRVGELRFTWQPEPGVRQAAVLVSYNGNNVGFVLAGRSL